MRPARRRPPGPYPRPGIPRRTHSLRASCSHATAVRSPANTRLSIRSSMSRSNCPTRSLSLTLTMGRGRSILPCHSRPSEFGSTGQWMSAEASSPGKRPGKSRISCNQLAPTCSERAGRRRSPRRRTCFAFSPAFGCAARSLTVTVRPTFDRVMRPVSSSTSGCFITAGSLITKRCTRALMDAPSSCSSRARIAPESGRRAPQISGRAAHYSSPFRKLLGKKGCSQPGILVPRRLRTGAMEHPPV
jgi:hypothetical protein